MAEAASEKVTLRHDISVNGVTYPAGGSIDVPKEQAADIRRIDDDATNADLYRVKDHEAKFGSAGDRNFGNR